MTEKPSSLRVALISKRQAGSPTGLSRYAHSLYTALKDQGIDVIAQTPPQVSVSGLLKKTGYDVGAFYANYPLWASFDGDASICHLSSQNLATLLTWRRPSTPVVVTVHDIIPHVLRNDRRLSSYRHVVDRWCDNFAIAGIAKADAIIADSEATKRDLIHHLGLPESRITVVPLGVDHQRFRPTPVTDSFRQRFGISDGHRYILYVGSEAPHKNVATLLEAFAIARERHPDIKLLKVGTAQSQNQRQQIQALADRLGVNDSVMFFDSVADEDLALFYSVSSVFVSPSLYEGFGLPELEAMACGTPVVCFAAGSLPEVVGDAGLLVTPHSHEALADGIHSLLSDNGLHQRLSRAGMRQAQTFTWQRTARETMAVYQALAWPQNSQVVLAKV